MIYSDQDMAMTPERAVWEAISSIAEYSLDGKAQGLLENTHFGSSKDGKESFVWVVVSDEQRKNLQKRPFRKALNQLTDRLMEDLEEPLTVTGGRRPKIAFVRESHVDRLFRWIEARKLDVI